MSRSVHQRPEWEYKSAADLGVSGKRNICNEAEVRWRVQDDESSVSARIQAKVVSRGSALAPAKEL